MSLKQNITELQHPMSDRAISLHRSDHYKMIVVCIRSSLQPPLIPTSSSEIPTSLTTLVAMTRIKTRHSTTLLKVRHFDSLMALRVNISLSSLRPLLLQ